MFQKCLYNFSNQLSISHKFRYCSNQNTVLARLITCGIQLCFHSLNRPCGRFSLVIAISVVVSVPLRVIVDNAHVVRLLVFCQRIYSIIVAGTYSWLLPSFRTSGVNVGFPVFFFNQMDRLVIVARPHSHGSIDYSSLSEHVSFSTLAKLNLRLIRPRSWNQSDWRSAFRL